MKHTILAAILGMILAAVVCAQDEPDVIQILGRDGKVVREQKAIIKAETWKQVEYKFPDSVGTGSTPWEQVGEITYGDRPFDYDRAMSAFRRREFDQAISSFENLAREAEADRVRKFFGQHALYYVAESYRVQGDFDKAATGYEKLLKSFPDTRFYSEASFDLIRCFLGAGNGKKARDAADQVVRQVREQRMPEEWGLEAKLLGCQAMEAESASLALAEYSRLQGDARKFPEIAEKAQLGRARCLLKDSKPDQARKYFEELVAKSELRSILAGAWNGLGDCDWTQAQSSKKSEDYKSALLNYLHTVVLYAPLKNEGDEDEHARSLFYAGYCFDVLRGSLKDEEAKKEYRKRAAGLFQDCMNAYAGTVWAKKSSEKMRGL